MPNAHQHRRLIHVSLLSLGAALLVGYAPRARCQTRDTATAAPQAVGTAFLNAIHAADWTAAAAFLDIVPLDHYRLAQIDMVRRMSSQPPMTVERLMSANPKLPRAVAEYEVEQMKERRGRTSALEYDFGVADPDSLAALTPSAVAQRWLEVHDPRWRLRKAIMSSNCSSAALDSLPAPAFRVLGTIVAGPLAYLLYERDDEPPPITEDMRGFGPRILTLRRGMDGWWVLPRIDQQQGFVGLSKVECVGRKPK